MAKPDYVFKLVRSSKKREPRSYLLSVCLLIFFVSLIGLPDPKHFSAASSEIYLEEVFKDLSVVGADKIYSFYPKENTVYHLRASFGVHNKNLFDLSLANELRKNLDLHPVLSSFRDGARILRFVGARDAREYRYKKSDKGYEFFRLDNGRESLVERFDSDVAPYLEGRKKLAYRFMEGKEGIVSLMRIAGEKLSQPLKFDLPKSELVFESALSF